MAASATDSGAAMTDWIVRRWARYGHVRLYAETPGGTALGYYDVTTERFHSDDHANLPLLRRAIADHLGDQVGDQLDSQGGNSAPATPEALAATPAPEPPRWHDLSSTAPGAAARERALAERAAQGTVKHLLSRLVGARTDERAWRIGADGEQAVAAQLARLGPSWRLLHAVPVGTRGSDIDHVAIGPPGVFTINAKHHPDAKVWVGGDTVMVNGQRVPYVRNSRHEASRAARLLSEHAGFPVPVVGVIAVMGAHRGMTVKRQPEDGAVVVVQRRRISQHLAGRPPRLGEREVQAIYDAARRSTTWQG